MNAERIQIDSEKAESDSDCDNCGNPIYRGEPCYFRMDEEEIACSKSCCLALHAKEHK